LQLVLAYKNQTFPLSSRRVLRIGRAEQCELALAHDDLVSNHHAIVRSGCIIDQSSTNGTLRNGKPVRKQSLQLGDVLKIGDCVLDVRRAGSSNKSSNNKYGSNRHSQHDAKADQKGNSGFPPLGGGGKKKNSNSKQKQQQQQKKELSPEAKAEAKMTVEQLMDKEFKQLIGCDAIKAQLRSFHKKVQLDKIRAANKKSKAGAAAVTDTSAPLYHALFSGPPGTGKTSTAKMLAKIMVKMGLLKSDKVVVVPNPLSLLGQYVGSTAPIVDAIVASAEGGVLFIDEAASIVKSAKHQADSFGKEAIETLMKHMDENKCSMFFAGYKDDLAAFLKVNAGLARRIPYRFEFEPFTAPNMQAIFELMCSKKGEQLNCDAAELVALIESIDEKQRASQNGGMLSNWLSLSQIERDTRLPIADAVANPELASILEVKDLEAGLVKVKQAV
jgi:SpoVK/Ycf46/Vps4 family AAA+-type ATPase